MAYRAPMPTDTTRIGVCSWSLKPQGPAHLIELLGRLDIANVQLALNPVIDVPGLWSGAIDLIRGAGHNVVSGMMATAGEDYSTLESIKRTGGVRMDASWEQNRKAAHDIAYLTDHNDIKLVTFHAGFLPEDRSDDERGTMIDRLRAIADEFGERDINIALETGQETADTLLDVLDELDRGNVGVNFDPANMILYGMGDPTEALRKLKMHVKQMHIKDAKPAQSSGEWGTEVPAGEGAVDWSALFEIAETLDPSVYYIIERESGDDRLADVRSARELIEKHIATTAV